MVASHKRANRKKATINNIVAFLTYCVKHDRVGNIVKLAPGTQMKQVSCHQVPLCQGDMFKNSRAGLDVVLFLSSTLLFMFIIIYFGQHSS